MPKTAEVILPAVAAPAELEVEVEPAAVAFKVAAPKKIPNRKEASDRAA